VHTQARPHPRRTLLVLTLPALAYSLSQTMLIPAFGDMVTELHSDVAAVTWVLTAYLVSASVFTPLVGRLGDMFGKRRMLVLSLVAFAVGSIVSAVGGNLELVVAGRVIQGVAGGLFPLCFGIIRDEFPPDQVGSSVGLVSATLGIGGGAGLLLGGVLVDAAGYASIFWLGAVAAVLSMVALQLWVPESPVRKPGHVDLGGAALLGLGLVLELVGVSQGATWGWGDPRTLAAFAAGLVVLGLWGMFELRTEEPLVDVRALGRPAILLTNVATLLVGFGMFGAYVLVPQLVEAAPSTGYGFGASATHAGLLMLPGSLSMLVFAPISGTLGSRYGHRVSLGLGGVITSFGLLMLAFFHGSDASIAVFFFLVSTGIAFAFAAMPNLILSAVPASQSGQATGFNAVVRSVGSSVGTQVTAVIVIGSAVSGSTVPRDSGYVTAFLLCAAFAIVAAAVAFIVPRTPPGHVRIGDEIGAGSLLPDPAYAADGA
jgi:EmrB/QacA subfamily drug resistance transporter